MLERRARFARQLVRLSVLGVGISFFQSCGGTHVGVGTSTLAQAAEPIEVESTEARLELTRVAGPLAHPWGLAFLPDGGMLVTERDGTLRRVDAQGNLVEEPVAGVPEVWARGQGGLLDVTLHPEFERNRTVYLSYSGPAKDGQTTHVLRAQLEGNALVDARDIFVAQPGTGTGRHFGSRMVFGGDGKLYVSIGDRGVMDTAQDTSVLMGKIVRLNDDGTVPEDNPFVGDEEVLDPIFAYGVRNPQGMDLHPETGELWEQEHGPRGGDEVNVIRAGNNYGWPEVTHGIDYSGLPISNRKTAPGITDPLHVWVPSIAPSGMAFYNDDLIPEWSGDILVGALKYQLLVRLDVEGGEIVGEERFLENEIGRIRDVRVGPDGAIYLLNDEPDGGIYRLAPVVG